MRLRVALGWFYLFTNHQLSYIVGGFFFQTWRRKTFRILGYAYIICWNLTHHGIIAYHPRRGSRRPERPRYLWSIWWWSSVVYNLTKSLRNEDFTISNPRSLSAFIVLLKPTLRGSPFLLNVNPGSAAELKYYKLFELVSTFYFFFLYLFKDIYNCNTYVSSHAISSCSAAAHPPGIHPFDGSFRPCIIWHATDISDISYLGEMCTRWSVEERWSFYIATKLVMPSSGFY